MHCLPCPPCLHALPPFSHARYSHTLALCVRAASTGQRCSGLPLHRAMLSFLVTLMACGICGRDGHNRRGHDKWMRKNGGGGGNGNGNSSNTTPSTQTSRPQRTTSSASARSTTSSTSSSSAASSRASTTSVPATATATPTFIAVPRRVLSAGSATTYSDNMNTNVLMNVPLRIQQGASLHCRATENMDQYADELAQLEETGVHLLHGDEQHSIEMISASADEDTMPTTLPMSEMGLASLLSRLVQTMARRDIQGRSTVPADIADDAGFHAVSPDDFLTQTTTLGTDNMDVDLIVVPNTLTDLARPLNPFSITVTVSRSHVPECYFTAFCGFLDNVILPSGGQGFVGREAGRRLGQVHLQAAVLARAPGGQPGAVEIRDYIAEHVCMWVRGRKISVKAFTGDQSMLAMCGYCQKDRGKSHYRFHSVGLSDDELQRALEMYAVVRTRWACLPPPSLPPLPRAPVLALSSTSDSPILHSTTLSFTTSPPLLCAPAPPSHASVMRTAK